MTGFRFELLDELALSGEAAKKLDAVLEVEQCLRDVRARLIDAALRGSLPEPLRRKMWRSVRRGQRLPQNLSTAELSDSLQESANSWERAIQDLDQASGQARSQIEIELEDLRDRLRTIASDARFQEAVWLSSPDMLDRGLAWYLRQPPASDPDDVPFPHQLEIRRTDIRQNITSILSKQKFLSNVPEARPRAPTVRHRLAR